MECWHCTRLSCIYKLLYTLNSPSQYGGFIFRQLLRSPHSKRSQRRHSPYTSLDSSRFVAIEFFKIKIYVFQTNFHHHIRLKSHRWICQASYLCYNGAFFFTGTLLCRGRRSRSRSPVRRQRWMDGDRDGWLCIYGVHSREHKFGGVGRSLWCLVFKGMLIKN